MIDSNKIVRAITEASAAWRPGGVWEASTTGGYYAVPEGVPRGSQPYSAASSSARFIHHAAGSAPPRSRAPRKCSSRPRRPAARARSLVTSTARPRAAARRPTWRARSAARTTSRLDARGDLLERERRGVRQPVERQPDRRRHVADHDVARPCRRSARTQAPTSSCRGRCRRASASALPRSGCPAAGVVIGICRPSGLGVAATSAPERRRVGVHGQKARHPMPRHLLHRAAGSPAAVRTWPSSAIHSKRGLPSRPTCRRFR